MFNTISNLPKNPPLNWRLRADQFLDYVLQEDNKVMHTLPNGHTHFTAFLDGSGQELITYGGMVIGRLLRGEDVRHLLPSLEDYYQEEYGIYQNGVGDKRSEYWYLMHVNALAAAITRLALMDDPISVRRLHSSMDRLIAMAHQIEYDFNDQGYDFEHGVPWTYKDAFRQPDTIGGYAYLMQFAYETFSEEKYRDEANKALEMYLEFEQNPWYEIPSGAMACLATAKLNADGGNFPLDKAIHFALDSEEGSLHLGQWGNEEISGLMRGWRGHTREESSSMAYSLETLVLLPYLLPIARYDVQFAKDIARYTLHTAANARLFYGEFLPEGAEGRPDLTPLVPYEALHRQHGEHSPYATGDFHGQKSVYGGGLVLWWGEIVRPTSDRFVLELDLTKTDFLALPSDRVNMYYNPYEHDVDVAIQIGPEFVDIYDVHSQSVIYANVNKSVTLHLPADSVTMVSLRPRAERDDTETGARLSQGGGM